MVHLSTSRSGLACAQFDAIERDSKDSAVRVLAAFNLGVAAATAGDLSRAEAAFTRALATLATARSSRDIHKVRFDVPCRRGTVVPFRRCRVQVKQMAFCRMTLISVSRIRGR